MSATLRVPRVPIADPRCVPNPSLSLIIRWIDFVDRCDWSTECSAERLMNANFVFFFTVCQKRRRRDTKRKLCLRPEWSCRFCTRLSQITQNGHSLPFRFRHAWGNSTPSRLLNEWNKSCTTKNWERNQLCDGRCRAIPPSLGCKKGTGG